MIAERWSSDAAGGLAIDAAVQRLHRQEALVGRDRSGVSALLGLDGFVVTAQLLDDATDEWWLGVETLEDRA